VTSFDPYTTSSEIRKFTGNGIFITKWGVSGPGDGEFSGLLGVAVNGDGNVYVADEYNNRIQVFRSYTPTTPPVAAFTANVTTGFAPLAVQFTDTSTGNVTSWFWSFGDGTHSTLQNPQKTFLTNGNYTVSLTASNSGGSNTTTKTDYIAVHLRADFNRNGWIDIGDVAKVAWMATGIVEEDPEADFNGDGRVDGADAAHIAYFYVGKIQTI